MCVKKITHILLKSVAIYRHTNQTEVLKLNSNSKNRMIFRASFNVSLNIKKQLYHILLLKCLKTL